MREEMPDVAMPHSPMCKCVHQGVIPALAFLFGLLFLGGNLDWWGSGFVDLGWPLLVMLAGLSKLKERSCRCC